MSLTAVIGALGLKLAILEDPEALARIRHRLTQRQIDGERLEVIPRRRCRMKAARELAAALMKLQKGRRARAL
jgi:hypothetical protein